MSLRLLIVTPQANFGTAIRKALPTDAEVFITSDFSEAVQFAHRVDVKITLLDAELEDSQIALLDIGIALRQIRRDMQFVLAISEGQKVDIKEVPVYATLTKPINEDELQKLINEIQAAPATYSGTSQPTQPDNRFAPDNELAWLNDVGRAARHLTRLTLESSSQAALITHHTELWAYAGQLSREAAQELASSINKYWDTQSQVDLMRFIRLEATEAQHMLYAKRLTASMILAMVFDAETPFSKIRSQAGTLVRSLSEIPDQTGQMSLSSAQITEDDEQNELDQDLPPIADLLGEVPPPFSAGHSGNRENQTTPAAGYLTNQAPSQPLFTSAAFSRESSPAMPLNSLRKNDISSLEQTRVSKTPLSSGAELDQETQEEDLQVTRVSAAQDVHATRRQEKESDQSLVGTRPQSVTEVAHRIMLEPVSPAQFHLSYACLLLPRFDYHYLTGDLAERLSSRVPQICVAFGWRLEHMSVRPDYLQFIVNVPPQTAPGYVMRIIRQQTSELIFGNFPQIKTENPSGDFWAPGYLIIGGSQPHPQQIVREFIRQTRQHQGVIKP